MDKRTLVVIVITVGLLFMWQEFVAKPYYEQQQKLHQEQTPQERAETLANAATSETESITVELPVPEEAVTDETDRLPVPAAAELQTLTLANADLKLDLTNHGGEVTELTLLNYVRSETEQVRLAGPVAALDLTKANKTYPLALLREIDSERAVGGLYQAAEADIHRAFLQSSFEYKPNQSVLIAKEVALSDSGYQMDLVITLTNPAESKNDVILSEAELNFPDGTKRSGSLLLKWGPGLGGDSVPERYRPQYVVTGHYLAEEEKKDVRYTGGFFAFTGAKPRVGAPSVKWAALSNQYFLVCLKPEFKEEAAVLFVQSEKPGKKNDGAKVQKEDSFLLLLPPVKLAPGESRSFPFSLYAGPKKTENLAAVDESLIVLDGMEPHLFPVSVARFLRRFLNFIHGYVGNYGWAIIIMTVIVKLLLFPVTHHQFKSMRKMQAVQPLMKELQEKHKNDKERLNREVMKLYSEHRVNPLGGCLPMILQIPIFFGLFVCLRNAIELRGAPFMLWIDDLSTPDTIAHIGGIPLNVLPLLMAVTMLLQQKLSINKQSNPDQARMMMFMPLMMVVFFYSFPSGLTLYWLLQNVLSVAQQAWINHSLKDMESRMPAAAGKA